MKKAAREQCKNIVFTSDNVENMKNVINCYKNILICGIKGVGKITNTVQAVQDRTNVYYSGNPVDFEGKSRPGSYEKYLKYIVSLKKDIKRVDDVNTLVSLKDKIILIIDEIYGRSEEQLAGISRLYDMENIQILQVVGCMKSMGALINKVDVIVELHNDGAFIVDNELGKAICAILGKK
jgi:S-adenosylhomocysteine hydrolase